MSPRHALTIAALVAASLLASGGPKGALAQPAAPSPAAPGGGSGAMSGVNFDMTMLVKAPLGSWSDYTMSKAGSDKSLTIRYAIVEKTAQKLGLEIDTPTPQGEVVMRFDFVAQPNAWKLVGGKMQRGDEKRDMPKEQIDATPPLKNDARPGDLVGTENVTIPSGTFACKHYRAKVAADPQSPVMDMWVSDKVSPTGLVKSELSPLGIGMQLAAQGSGAQSKTK